MISNFFYYVLYASAVLVYGIGINRTVIRSNSSKKIIRDCVKMLVSVVASASLTYVITVHLLVEVNATELYPFVAVIVFSVISIFIEAVIRITAKKSAAEYSVSILSVLIGVNESLSLFECVINTSFCVLSFFLVLPIFYSIRCRIDVSNPNGKLRKVSLLIVSIAAVMIALFVFNASWLNQGGAKW